MEVSSFSCMNYLEVKRKLLHLLFGLLVVLLFYFASILFFCKKNAARNSMFPILPHVLFSDLIHRDAKCGEAVERV